MALILLLVCLGAQRYLHINSYTHHINWVQPYVDWMMGKVTQISSGHGLLGVTILVLPLVILVALVFSLIYHLLGWAGYYVLSLLFLWYCIDGRDLRKYPVEGADVRGVFSYCYQHLFAVIFWFFIFGPVGLAIYISIYEVSNYLAAMAEKPPSLHEHAIKVHGVLDWVPERLLGLSFALVGHFATVFKLWLKDLKKGLAADNSLAADWGMAAMADSNQLPEAILLIDRSLLVWLVVIALFSIGYWLG